MTAARTVGAVCLVALLVCFSLGVADSDANAQRKYGAVAGLYADASHSDCDVIGTGFLPFEMWVWWYPTDFSGMMAAEFAISYPANVIQSTVTANPAIAVSLGDLPGGISVAFGSCQSGWIWTHHQQCYLFNTPPSSIQIIPHPTYGLQIADCTTGYPLWPAAALTSLCLNQGCACPTLNDVLPKIAAVNITASTALRASFDMCVESDYINPLHFILHNKANPTDSIKVAQATWVDDHAYDLVLQRAMADSTTYVLLAREAWWSCSYAFSNHSELEFTFFKAIGTKETSWGAIKALFGR